MIKVLSPKFTKYIKTHKSFHSQKFTECKYKIYNMSEESKYNSYLMNFENFLIFAVPFLAILPLLKTSTIKNAQRYIGAILTNILMENTV